MCYLSLYLDIGHSSLPVSNRQEIGGSAEERSSQGGGEGEGEGNKEEKEKEEDVRRI